MSKTCTACYGKRYYTVMTKELGKQSLPCPRCNKDAKTTITVKCVDCGLKQAVPLEKAKGTMPPMCKECFGCCLADSINVQHS